MAAKAPFVCLLLLLVASAVLISPPGADAADCDQWSKLEKCKGALLREEESVTDGCCKELSAQYGCLCEYTRMPNPEFLHLITEEVGGLVMVACDLEPVSCPNLAAAAATA
ncbi:unnamed protein product [Alopecurus aequalis]